MGVFSPRQLRIGFGLGLVAAALALRGPGLSRKVWSVDEGSTFTMAHQILHGGVPYLEAADNRNPLTACAKALVYAVAGDWNITAVHAAVALLLGLAAVLLWRTARRLGDEPAGVAAAVWFTLLSFVYLAVYDTMAAHTGWFLVFFSVLGVFAFARAWTAPGAWPALGAGAAFGFSCLAKQPALLDFGVVFVVMALGWWFEPARRRELFRTALGMVAGFAVPVALTVAWLGARGALHDFVLYSWTYNTKYYVPEIPRLQRLLAVQVPFRLALTNAPAALAAGVAGGVGLLALAFGGLRARPPRVNALPWLVLGWTASGLVSTALSGRTFDHYSMQLLAPLALACGWATARLVDMIRRARRPLLVRGLITLIAGMALSLLWPAVQRARSFEPDDEAAVQMGEAVHALTGPEDRIFVWGYAPEMYVFARREPATRFLYTNYLTGLIPWTNLDPEKNTDYAVIPGAWDEFWSDWKAHPPEVIIDTLRLRGYLKYPLERQPALWPVVQRDYVEVNPSRFRHRGYRVFRRVSPVEARGLDPAWPVDAGIRLEGRRGGPPADRRFTVDAPSGTKSLELYFDGTLYRRVPVADPGEVEAVFTVLADRLTPGPHEVRAVAVGAHPAASRPYATFVGTEGGAAGTGGGPPLLFADRSIAALETETIDGSPIRLSPEGGWDAHAPSRLVYPRPPEMDQIVISYGIRAGAYGPAVPKKTDGYGVVVNFEDDNGENSRVFYRFLDPVKVGRDQGPQTDRVALPIGRRGRIILQMTTGPMNDPTADWTYWESIKGYRGPLAIQFRGQSVYPERSTAEMGAIPMTYRDLSVIVAHAPSIFEFPLQAGMVELSGSFGLLDTAWSGPEKTIGAVFEIEHLRPDGTRRMLLQRALDPAQYEVDRGVIPFRLKLPQPAEGKLRLITRSPDALKINYCYTFWHNLQAHEFAATLLFDGRKVMSLGARSDYGLSLQEEDGRTVLLAHAPSTIVFPLEPGMRHLHAGYGLLRGAFTAPHDTDGAVFVVEVDSASGGKTELFRKHLNPMHEGAHQVPQELALDLPERPGGRLILRTEPAPSGRLAYAWSYWRDLAAGR